MNEPSGRTRKIAKLAKTISHIVAVATLVTFATIAAAGAAAGEQGPGFQPAPARIAFVDGSGDLLRAPSFDIAGAYPGMPAQRTSLSLRNIGDLEETFSVSSRLYRPGARSLDDVLQVSVKDRATGEVVYRGKLSGLSFDGVASLATGESATYAVTITWPQTGKDDLYQGLGLSFALRGDARPVAA